MSCYVKLNQTESKFIEFTTLKVSNNYKTVPLITAPCSNIQIVLYFFLLSILGHEGVIEVIKHKVTNNNVNVGDRLTFSIADSCLQCERCEDGIEQKCTALFKVYIPSLFFLR